VSIPEHRNHKKPARTFSLWVVIEHCTFQIVGRNAELVRALLSLSYREYEDVSKIFRTDAVKIIKLTIRPIAAAITLEAVPSRM
jgi:hypothetical protein